MTLLCSVVFQALKTALDAGKDLGMPDGVLINGKGPYQYNKTLVPDGILYETINVEPGILSDIEFVPSRLVPQYHVLFIMVNS